MNARDYQRIMTEEGLQSSRAVQFFLDGAIRIQQCITNLQRWYLKESLERGSTGILDGITNFEEQKEWYIRQAIDTARAEKYLGFKIEESGDKGILQLYQVRQKDKSFEMDLAWLAVNLYWTVRESEWFK